MMTKSVRKVKKNIVMLLMVLILLFSSIYYTNIEGKAINNIASETDAVGESIVVSQNESTYIGEGYEVKFEIDNEWETGYTATITIKNTGDITIENWCMSFPLQQSVSNIWNASIERNCEDFYVVKNVGWNQDIAVGAEVSFGLSVNQKFTQFPTYYTMIGKDNELLGDDYIIDYVITEDWGEGYKAEITIFNNKAVPIEDWKISFDYNDNLITQIWSAEILDWVDGRYEISCTSYNQNIPVGGSVTFGIMVEPGCSGNGIENVSLKEKETDISNGQAIIIGYMKEANLLALSMLVSKEVKRYEIWASYDSDNFIRLGETEEDFYCHILNKAFNTMEIYAMGYDTAGFPMRSNHIFVKMSDGKYTVILPDTDGDGLEDCYEIYYGSDINLVDTDGDGLNDYYEVYASYTNPALEDSDENGIWDGDEDYDEDKFTNFEEYELGTDPVNSDTDEDGLLDGEEVKVYKTDPLVADIDEDYLVDGDEIALGTDPFDEDSDDDGILDGDERFEQTFTHIVKNKECVIDEISLTLEGTGNLQTNTDIESVMDKDVLCTGVVGLIGEPFEIETESEFDAAIITFKLDKEQLGDTSFEDLIFLWYNEDEPAFVELQTTLDKENMTVSVETTHFSKYMIVDKKVWHEAWSTEINYNADNGIDTYYTVITIDCSGSMSRNDPIIYNNNISSLYDATYNRITCNRIKGALEFVDCMGEKDKVAVILFDDSAFYLLDFTNNKEEIKFALQKVCNNGGTNYNRAIKRSIDLFNEDILNSSNICTRIVFLSDGEGTCSESYINAARSKNIIIHGIGLGNGFDDSSLKEMSEGTEGSYYQADSSDMLLKLYEKIYIYDQFDKTDNDNDGLYDIFETVGIRLINGQVIYTNPTDDDSDDDGLLDGEEIIPEVKKIEPINFLYVNLSSGNWYYLSMMSNPNSIDSERDGILDAVDNKPMQKGYYSEERGVVVIGKLTIASSMYNYITGHSFLVYKSYINDTLDFNDITGGYFLIDNNTNYKRTAPCYYDIKIGQYVSLGNSGIDADGGKFQPIEGRDIDDAGIFFNREFAVEIQYINSEKQKYKTCVAYDREITEEELERVIGVHNELNYYNIFINNCADVATKAWNTGFSTKEFNDGFAKHMSTPWDLFLKIIEKEDYYILNLRNLL